MVSETRGISEALQRFVAQHITSLDQLEVLLLLRRHPSISWTAESVSREIRIETSWAARRLEDLKARGFIVAAENGTAYRFAPTTEELARLIDELSRLYAERRLVVIELVYAPPGNAIRSFAAAFRFRKDESDG